MHWLPRLSPACLSWLVVFVAALLPSAAFAANGICAPSVGGGGILTGFVNQFSTTTGPWTATALKYAQDLFFALAAVEMAWSGITFILQKDSLPDFVAALALKLLSVGFFFMLLQPAYGPAWISDIIQSFSQAGSAIGGETQFVPSDPSAVFGCGTDIANVMLQSLSKNNSSVNVGNILPTIEGCVVALVCALAVVLAFALVSGQLLIALVESYIVVGGGIFMLGFTGSRWTLVLGEKYFGYVFSVGIKLFMLELIVGLGFGLGQQWANLFANGAAQPETYLEVVGAALIFCFVAWQIPGMAAALMNGAPRMTLGAFLGAAAGAAVAGLAATSAAGALVSGGTSAAVEALAALRGAAEAGQGVAGAAATDGFGDVAAEAAGRQPETPAGERPNDLVGQTDAASSEEAVAPAPPETQSASDDEPEHGSGDDDRASDSSSAEGDEAGDGPDSHRTGDPPSAGDRRARRRSSVSDDPDVAEDDGGIQIRFKHTE